MRMRRDATALRMSAARWTPPRMGMRPTSPHGWCGRAAPQCREMDTSPDGDGTNKQHGWCGRAAPQCSLSSPLSSRVPRNAGICSKTECMPGPQHVAACRGMLRNAAECRVAGGCRGIPRNDATGFLGMHESGPKLNARQDRSMSQHAAECCGMLGMPGCCGMPRNAAKCREMQVPGCCPRNAGIGMLRNAAECRDAVGCCGMLRNAAGF